MTRNHMELTHADDLDAEELELISQYVAHEMSAAEEQRFERRLADDERFFDRVMPLLDVWYDTDVWPIEPTVVPMSAPAKRATRVWLGLVGGSGVVATAAGIAFTMVMRSGGVPPVQLPIAADRDAPPQVPPVVVKAPVVAPVVAEHTPTFRGSQRTLDSAIQRAVAAAIDTAGLRLVAELDRKGLPEVQFAPPQVTVVAAWPASPKMAVRILVMVDSAGSKKDGPTNVGNRGWLGRVIDRIKRRPPSKFPVARPPFPVTVRPQP